VKRDGGSVFNSPILLHDRLCGLVVRVPGYSSEMDCVSYEVRTEFICYVEESRPPLYCVSCEVRTEFIYVT
jgi:hypothetical protein